MMFCDPEFRQLSTHKSWSDCNNKAWDSTALTHTEMSSRKKRQNYASDKND